MARRVRRIGYVLSLSKKKREKLEEPGRSLDLRRHVLLSKVIKRIQQVVDAQVTAPQGHTAQRVQVPAPQGSPARHVQVAAPQEPPARRVRRVRRIGYVLSLSKKKREKLEESGRSLDLRRHVLLTKVIKRIQQVVDAQANAPQGSPARQVSTRPASSQ